MSRTDPIAAGIIGPANVVNDDIQWSFYNVSSIIRRMQVQIEDLQSQVPEFFEETGEWIIENFDEIEDLDEEYGALLHSAKGHDSCFAEHLGDTLAVLKRTAAEWQKVVICPYYDFVV
jgi:hypothetical protein